MTSSSPEQGYTVVGAGAIGGTLAAHLDANGVPVRLVDTDAEHVAAIREHGLRLETPDLTLTARVPVSGPDEAPDRLGAVLLAVKAQATAAAVEWIAPRLVADGWVVSLQNGLNEPLVAAAVGPGRTVSAFVDLFADVTAPGVVTDGGHGTIALGEYAGEPSRRVSRLAGDLCHWGSPVITENVDGYLWAKLGFGAMLTATALADADMADLIDRHRPVMHALATEVFEVSDALGVRLEGFDAFYPELYRRDADPAGREEATDQLVDWLRTQRKTRSGIWRDLAVRRRPTEVPAQYAPVLALARTEGLDLPLITRLVDAVSRLERGTIAMSESLIDELTAPSEEPRP